MEKQVLKKLVLKKETISNLSNNSMNQIVGGTGYCESDDGTRCCYTASGGCGNGTGCAYTYNYCGGGGYESNGCGGVTGGTCNTCVTCLTNCDMTCVLCY